MRIERHADMRGYFRERLQAAMERRQVEAAELTEFYLVDLLARFAETGAASVQRPLVHQLTEALEAPDAQTRLRRFREMGDTALYVCGFFFEYLRRRGITRDYVVAMGGRAYRRAGDLAPWAAGPGEAGFGDAYQELGGRFDEFAGVLDDVREETALRTAKDIVRLYDRWKQTGSPLLAERLRAEGVYPQGGSGSSTLH